MELAGWALFNQGSYPEAVKFGFVARSAFCRDKVHGGVRACRAAWGHAGSRWQGKGRRWITCIQSYKTDKPDLAKFILVESLYRKLNGSTEGLEAAIGTNRMMASTTAATASTSAAIAAEPTPEPAAARPAEASESQVAIPKGVPVDTAKPVVPSEAGKTEPENMKPQVEPSTVPVVLPSTEPPEKKTDEVKPETAARSESTRPPATEPTPSAVPVENSTLKEPVKETETKAPATSETPVATDQNRRIPR